MNHKLRVKLYGSVVKNNATIAVHNGTHGNKGRAKIFLI